MAELYRRNVRIACDPKALIGTAVKITDADTGETIPGVFKAVVTLDALKTNQAEISYYETKADGAVRTGPNNEPVVHVETVADPEVDITALERSHMDLGDGASVIALPNAAPDASYLSVRVVGDTGIARMTPTQALALLPWLKVSEADLQKAALHHNAPDTLARVEEAHS